MFCRHNRLEATCPICSKKQKPVGAASGGATRRSSRPARAPSSQRRRSSAARGASTLSVRRMARAADDGYEHDLLPGLRATDDAIRLASELAFSEARLRELADDPPGLYAEVAGAGEAEEAAWLAFQIALLSPLEAEDPWSAIAAVRTAWATGELPRVEDAARGPRAASGDAAAAAYRAWAGRAGSQAAAFTGDSAWSPERRFDRAFERLSLPGFGRGPRYELLVLLGRLGVFDLRASSLQFAGEPTDPTVAAAKRVFGIGDPLLLGRRASALAAAAGVPLEALDLALLNFAAAPGGRVTAASRAEADPDRVAAIRAVVGAD
ncbi:MAG: alpha-glutamyl/putrescinyl thymine pyrophosphorylase clade 3 protein [Solirubrobacteraceae bacterium]